MGILWCLACACLSGRVSRWLCGGGREAVGACVAAGEEGAVLELVETTLPRLLGREHEGLRAWLIVKVSSFV